MSEPSLALQGALVSCFKADSALSALIGTRIYDRVPADPVFPYIRVGDDQIVADGADCFDESVEVFATIHVFSRAVGKPEAKNIAGAVVAAIRSATLTLSGYSLCDIEHQGTRYLDDPDTLTTHGVVTFHAMIDPA